MAEPVRPEVLRAAQRWPRPQDLAPRRLWPGFVLLDPAQPVGACAAVEALLAQHLAAVAWAWPQGAAARHAWQGWRN